MPLEHGGSEATGMIDVLIEGLGVAGDGVARLPDGRVVFVPGGLPGDRAKIRLTLAVKKVQYADLLEVVEPSKERVVSRCQVERCGGCALRSLSPAGQAEAKRKHVVETLRRIGGIEVDLPPVRQFGDGWRYRHRVRLHAAFEEEAWRLGYHARKSRDLVPLTSCPVLWPELENAANTLARALKKLPRGAKLESVELAYSRRDGRAAARVHAEGSVKVLRGAWLDEAALSGIEILATDGRWRHGNLELRYDHAKAETFDLRFEPGVFTQAHPQANDRLVELVTTHVRPRETPRVIELHAGIGNFSLPLALAGAKVTAVEHNTQATILARRNLERAGVTATIIEAPDEEADLREADVVVLDPPRTGARAVAEKLAKHPIARVIYVSCDVATLARDLAILTGAGYQVTASEAVDMFPETPHVETIVALER